MLFSKYTSRKSAGEILASSKSVGPPRRFPRPPGNSPEIPRKSPDFPQNPGFWPPPGKTPKMAIFGDFGAPGSGGVPGGVPGGALPSGLGWVPKGPFLG